ncbi:MAG: hypothetical protein J3K34DRAFT_400398 [Monoraphidium minutum]|nr:MAG: hypothetical protein J3K34DRAFT_400398 [Monoraphidium minutum]
MWALSASKEIGCDRRTRAAAVRRCASVGRAASRRARRARRALRQAHKSRAHTIKRSVCGAGPHCGAGSGAACRVGRRARPRRRVLGRRMRMRCQVDGMRAGGAAEEGTAAPRPRAGARVAGGASRAASRVRVDDPQSHACARAFQAPRSGAPPTGERPGAARRGHACVVTP